MVACLGQERPMTSCGPAKTTNTRLVYVGLGNDITVIDLFVPLQTLAFHLAMDVSTTAGLERMLEYPIVPGGSAAWAPPKVPLRNFFDTELFVSV